MRRALLALALLSGTAQAAAPPRWVLAIGAHEGDATTDRLRHAGADALAFADVMIDLGGVPRDQVIVLTDPSIDDVRQQLDRLATLLERARAEGQKPEVLVYYSGHADDRGLMPSGGRLPWGELRKRIQGLPADLRIAVVDACASGSFMRDKGGVHEQGFLTDRAVAITGDAFLTSASSDEAAQESDRLGGSYFTHHLVAGLRGAADADADLRVSLSEAYTYAYDHTVRGTELSWAGVQHPSYSIDLSGRGDVILTDLRQRSAAIAFDERLDGTITVRDREGRLLVELDKPIGSTLTYALPPGDYSLRLWTKQETFRSRVQVSVGDPAPVSAATFERVASLERTRLRGSTAPLWTRTHPFALHFAPFAGTMGTRRDTRLVGASLNIFGGYQAETRGFGLGTGLWTEGDLTGVDWQGILSWAGGQLQGWQLSFASSASSVTGAQTGAFTHTSGDLHGLQIGVADWTEGSLSGVQVGGLFSVARGRSAQAHRGVQFAMLANHAGNHLDGVQIGTVNHADSVRGFQGGAVNVAGEVHGLQIGVVNVAKHGRGEALGLFTIWNNGYHGVELVSDAYAPIHLRVKLGSKVIYSGVELGFDPLNGPIGVSAGWFLGAHAEKGRISFDTDLGTILPERTVRSLQDGQGFIGLDVRWTAALGVRIVPRLHAFLGPTVGFALGFDDASPDLTTQEAFFLPSYDLGTLTNPTTLWVGYQAGLRVTF